MVTLTILSVAVVLEAIVTLVALIRVSGLEEDLQSARSTRDRYKEQYLTEMQSHLVTRMQLALAQQALEALEKAASSEPAKSASSDGRMR